MLPTHTSRYCARCAATRLRRLEGERGAALVEYALIFMFLLTLVFGIMGFGHALYVYHFVNNAAKEATRYATVRGSTCANDLSCTASNSASGAVGPTTQADVQQFVQNITPPGIDSSKVTATLSWQVRTNSPQVCSQAVTGIPGSPIANYPGCTVQVQVSYPFIFVFPLLPVASATTAPCTQPGFCMSSTSDMIIVH